MNPKKPAAAVLISLGTIMTALSNWLLVWFFAHSADGVELVAAYSTILAIATPVFVICQLGLRTIALSSRVKLPWKTYWLLRWIGIFVGATGLIMFLFVSPRMQIGLGLAVIALKVCDSLLDLQLAVVQYGNRSRLLGLLMVTNAVLTIIVAGSSLLLTDSAELALGLSSLCSALVAILGYVRTRQVTVSSEGPIGKGSRHILRVSAPVMISQFLGAFLFQLPVLFLVYIEHGQGVGVFSAAAYLLIAANLIGGTLQTILITPFRRVLERQGPKELRRRLTVVAHRTVLFGLLLGGAIMLVGRPLFSFIYGEEFRIEILPLTLLVVGAVATTAAFVSSVGLLILNRYRQVTTAMGAACVVSVLIGVALSLRNLDPLTIACTMAAAGAVTRLLLMGNSVKVAAVHKK